MTRNGASPRAGRLAAAAAAFAVLALGWCAAASAQGTPGQIGPTEPPTKTSRAASPTQQIGSTPGPSTATPTSARTETAAASTSESSTPTGTASPTTAPTGSPAPTASPTSPTATATPAPVQRVATRPAVQDSGISLATALLAVAALALAGLVIWLVQRSGPGSMEQETARPRRPAGADSPAQTTSLLVTLGEAMIDSGYGVTQVQATLARVAAVGGVEDVEVVVLPTALFVSVGGSTTLETAVAAVGRAALRLDQVDAVSRVVGSAEAGTIGSADALAELRRARAQPPPYGPGLRTLGYAAFSVGVALVLQGSIADLLVAGVLGVVVGALQLAVPRPVLAYQAMLPLLCAFLVAVTVFLLGRSGYDVGVFVPLVAPLVTFLPGALLTTAVIELSTGQMISGAARVAAGGMQLVLLALGVVAGAQLVGVPVTAVDATAGRPLGDAAPWVGVALFGAGVVVHRCARRSSVGWILLVLYVAYGAQILGGLFLGGVLSAFVGALAMTPVASWAARRRTGPPTQVSFLPAFWLLVPGALGLVGVTQLLGEDRSDAAATLLATGTTMIGVSFGVLVGLAVGPRGPDPRVRVDEPEVGLEG